MIITGVLSIFPMTGVLNHSSVINLEITITNTKPQKEEVKVHSQILNRDSQIVGEILNSVTISGNEENQISQQIVLKQTELWEIESPYLYRAVTSVYEEAQIPDRIYKWSVQYSPGRLFAYGRTKTKIAKTELLTASALNSILLKADKDSFKSDNKDVLHITATLIDSSGNKIEICDVRIHFVVSSPCRILGVDNGSSRNIQNFQSNTIKTYRGQSLLIIQSTRKTGEITIKALSKDLKSNEISVTTA